MRVADIMEREVVTLGAEDALDLANDIMRLARIRHMPVVEGDRLVGILSQRDLFRWSVSAALRFKPTAEKEWLACIPVREVMTREVVTARPDAPIRDAVKLMVDAKVGCVPVVEGDKLVGLVSESDCLTYLLRLLDA